MSAVSAFAEFVTSASVPPRALDAARDAVLDTVGVILAGSVEPAARVVQAVARADGGLSRCSILGTADRTGAAWAALANGTAAHALDYDDVSFVSLAHPSAPLVGAGLAAAELSAASGHTLLEGYCVGFEVEAVLGRVMNPAHYQHGWHSTSTIGTVGAAAAAARVLGQDPDTVSRALSIAASEASGLKENFGTMVKPLHAGLAARNGVLAALLAGEGLTASERAIDGPQGFLVALRSQQAEMDDALQALGRDWEIIDGGITVKLYPSCAATHPTIDALIDLRHEYGLAPEDVEAIEIGVDEVTPTVLIYHQPTTGLESKFSMEYCAAAAVAQGRVGIDTFEPPCLSDPVIQRLVSRVTMRVDPSVGGEGAELTQARVRVRLGHGRILELFANGAHGHPARPASPAELYSKFRTCAARAVAAPVADQALAWLRVLDAGAQIGALTELLGRQSAVHSIA